MTREQVEHLVGAALDEAKGLRQDPALELVSRGAVVVIQTGLTRARLSRDSGIAIAILVGSARIAAKMLREAIGRNIRAIQHAHGRLQDVAAALEAIPGAAS